MQNDRNRIGRACIVLGSLLILAALVLFGCNQFEEQQAKQASAKAAVQIIEHFQTQAHPSEPEFPQTDNEPIRIDSTAPSNEAEIEEEATQPDLYSPEMPVVVIDGYGYIGYLSIPDLGKVLPIMSEWDYSRLKIAPCRYKGGTKTGDLIICAHNYASHFGDIASLDIGAIINITDMNGIATTYKVVEITELPPTAIEEMESSGYQLTLFTCTYGGRARITVRCIKVSG